MNCCVCPTAIVGLAGVTVMPCAAASFAVAEEDRHDNGEYPRRCLSVHCFSFPLEFENARSSVVSREKNGAGGRSRTLRQPITIRLLCP